MSDERKRSWRELDQARDRGVKISKTISKKEERENKQASQKAKQQLDALFSNSKLSKEKQARIQEIKALRGKPAYFEKMSAYISEFGTPVEWDAQIFFLDHRDSGLVIEVLEALKRTAPKETSTRQEVLRQKLKVMALSTFDSKLIDKIRELEKAISLTL